MSQSNASLLSKIINKKIHTSILIKQINLDVLLDACYTVYTQYTVLQIHILHMQHTTIFLNHGHSVCNPNISIPYLE